MNFKLILLSLLIPLPTLAINQVTTEHLVENIKVRFAANSEDEDNLWQTTVEQIREKFPGAELRKMETPHGILQALWIPGKIPSRLLLVTSGIHGAETYAGAALQRLFANHLAQDAQSPTSVLLIHVINPTGFKNFWRVNPLHVDLNRNFLEPHGFQRLNNDYIQQQALLEPKGAASASWTHRLIFQARVAWTAFWGGKKQILATLAGQTHSPKGLNYSGTHLQVETQVVQKWILEFGKSAALTLHIDLHTGFGQKGRLHFFGSENFNAPEQKKWLSLLFPHETIETADTDDFYSTEGDLVDWSWQALSPRPVVPMVFEFGTLDSQTLRGGLRSLWITVVENQGRHFGFKTTEDLLISQKNFQELFNPQSEDWQKSILEQGFSALHAAQQNLSKVTL